MSSIDFSPRRRRSQGNDNVPDPNLLTTTVYNSNGDPFVIGNRVYNSSGTPFYINADVLDSDGNPFTLFS